MSNTNGINPHQYGTVEIAPSVAADGPVTLPTQVRMDVLRLLAIQQTDAAVDITLPNTELTGVAISVDVANIGSEAFTMHGLRIRPQTMGRFLWQGTAWIPLSTHQEWNSQDDGLGDDVQDLTTAMRRNGNFGTSTVFTDSADNAATNSFLNTIPMVMMSKKSAGGAIKQYWSLLPISHVQNFGDNTVELNPVNAAVHGRFKVCEQLVIWEMSISSISNAGNGLIEYEVYLDAINDAPGTGTLLTTLTVNNGAPFSQENDFRTNKAADGPYLSTLPLTQPGQTISLVPVTAAPNGNYPTGVAFCVHAGLLRLGTLPD